MMNKFTINFKINTDLNSLADVSKKNLLVLNSLESTVIMFGKRADLTIISSNMTIKTNELRLNMSDCVKSL